MDSVALSLDLLRALEGLLAMPPRRDTSRKACLARIHAKRQARQVATAARAKVNSEWPLLAGERG